MTKKQSLINPHEPETYINMFSWHLHGLPKTGKTSLAMQWPKPILLASDFGYKAMRIGGVADIFNWADMEDAQKEILNKGSDVYETVVVDTIDRVIELLYAQICEDTGVDHISKLKFAQGYRDANQKLSDYLAAFTEAGINFVLVSHTREIAVDEGSVEIQRLVPDISNSPRRVLNAKVDMIGYLFTERVKGSDPPQIQRFIQVGPTPDVQAGGRVQFLATDVELTPTPAKGFANLTKEFDKAIERQLVDLNIKSAPKKRRK